MKRSMHCFGLAVLAFLALPPSVAAIAADAPAPTEAPGSVSFVDAQRGSGWLDFEFFRGQRIFIPARVNGHDTVVLLDSGAESSVLDSAFAASIGLDAVGHATAVGTGGTQDASFLPDIDVELGGMRLDGIAAAAIDLSAVAASVGHPLPVVLGNEVFAGTTIEIDFRNRRIAFHDPASYRAPEDARALAVVDGPSGIRRIEATIEGEGPMSFDFDLGNGNPLLLSAGHWQREGWLPARRSAGAYGGAIGGMREQRVTRVRTLDIAGFRFHDVPALLVPAEVSALERDAASGNLGLPLFTRFRLVVDYPRDRLLLSPAEGIDAPFVHDRSGLYTVKQADALKVAYVVPGTPAERAGWRAGDEIVAIDGIAVPALADPGAWRLGDAGSTVGLRLRDGTTRALVLTDYF